MRATGRTGRMLQEALDCDELDVVVVGTNVMQLQNLRVTLTNMAEEQGRHHSHSANWVRVWSGPHRLKTIHLKTFGSSTCGHRKKLTDHKAWEDALATMQMAYGPLPVNDIDPVILPDRG